MPIQQALARKQEGLYGSTAVTVYTGLRPDSYLYTCWGPDREYVEDYEEDKSYKITSSFQIPHRSVFKIIGKFLAALSSSRSLVVGRSVGWSVRQPL